MTTSRSFNNPVHLTREAVATLASLKRKVDRCRKLGYDDLVQDYNNEMLHVVNNSTLQSIASNTFDSENTLMFCELPTDEPSRQNKKLQLNLLLIANSPLAGEIIEVLKKHEGETHE